MVTELLKVNPGFKPPPDFRPVKKQRKIYVPIKEYPGYNFIGLIIGPRGNTQKRMQQESGAKIALRGRGSVKDGRGYRSGPVDSSDSEDLHVLITAENDEALEKVSCGWLWLASVFIHSALVFGLSRAAKYRLFVPS